MNSWSRFLLAMTLAGTVAAPALAQTTAPSGATPASIPDFSGFWMHPGLGFGPPLSGPGPVQTAASRISDRGRLRACLDRVFALSI